MAQNQTQPTWRYGQEHDRRILTALRLLAHALAVESHHLAAKSQVTMPQLLGLMEVVRRGPLRATDIAQRLRTSASTVVGIVDRLQSKGLVTRKRDSCDRRGVYIAATAAGQSVAESTPLPLLDVLSGALETLPEEEREEAVVTVERLAAYVDSNLCGNNAQKGELGA